MTMHHKVIPLLIALLSAAAARADEPKPGQLLALSDAERVALVQKSPRPELEALLRATSVDDLLALGRRVLGELGVYGAKLKKQERVKGELLDVQTLQLVVRDQPLAVRALFVDGPAKGRKLLYNAELRQDEMRVREAGFFSVMAIWLSLDSNLAKGDTNHRVTDMGFGALLRLIGHDAEQVKPLGGFQRIDEGFNERGAFCMKFVAPKGSEGLAGDTSRICVDPALGLPVESAVYKGGELLEKYTFEKVTPNLVVPANFFTPEAFGL
jgi:hypothetical protein